MGKISLIWGSVFTIIYFIVMNLIEFPKLYILLTQIAVCVAMKLIAKRLQGKIYDEYIKNGWKRASDWRAVGIGLFWSGIFFGLITLYSLIFEK